MKLTLVNTFCSPMYTAQLWCNYTLAAIHQLHVAYTNVFHFLQNQPKYCSASTMFIEYHVPGTKAVIRKPVYKFMLRLAASFNKLVIAIINSDIKWQSRIRRQWIKMLYIHNSFWLNVSLCSIILLPCAILLNFLVTCTFNVYVDICMIAWNKYIELNWTLHAY